MLMCSRWQRDHLGSNMIGCVKCNPHLDHLMLDSRTDYCLQMKEMFISVINSMAISLQWLIRNPNS